MTKKPLEEKNFLQALKKSSDFLIHFPNGFEIGKKLWCESANRQPYFFQMIHGQS